MYGRDKYGKHKLPFVKIGRGAPQLDEFTAQSGAKLTSKRNGKFFGQILIKTR